MLQLPEIIMHHSFLHSDSVKFKRQQVAFLLDTYSCGSTVDEYIMIQFLPTVYLKGLIMESSSWAHQMSLVDLLFCTYR